jgi:predicted DNA-binding protein with PD1-like motif
LRYSEASQGRIFVIRLEDGDIVHESIEAFASEKSIQSAALIIIGGADKQSRLVVGPEDGRAGKIVAMTHMLANVHEVAGTGTIFPDKAGKPVLHMHMACGRNNDTVTGCVRTGVKVWHVMEVVLFELIESSARRVYDEATGFELLSP